MQIINRETALVGVDTLRPHPRNVNQGNIGLIGESIGQNGFYGSLVVQQSTGHILRGNHTWQAARQAGATEIPVTYVDVDDETALRILLVDNRATRAGYDDSNALAVLLQELAVTPAALSGTGYDGDALDELLADLGQMQPELAGDPDAVPEVPAEPVSRPGDLWVLGDHRVLCGDAANGGDVERLLDGAHVQLIVTSPPYNQALASQAHPTGMHHDNVWFRRLGDAYADAMPEQAYQDNQVALLALWFQHTAPGGALFYNHKHRYRDRRPLMPLDWLRRTPWELRQEIIWDRRGGVAANAAMFIPGDERFYWLEKDGPHVWRGLGQNRTTVWPIAPQENNGNHVCPFPVELARIPIDCVSEPGGVVADPYAGSGTVLVAAEMAGRQAFLMEIEPRYVDVIVQRWQDLTGKKAEREQVADDARVLTS